METVLYKNIVKAIREYRGLSRDCLSNLRQQFPSVSYDTLHSILNQEYQNRMRRNHNKSESTINHYWTAYKESVGKGESAGIILRISQRVDVCPCLVAKLILQRYFEENNDNLSVDAIPLNNYLRDTNLIPDKNLAYEVFMCTLYDNLYSPLSDTMRNSLGQQYEIRLHNEIVELGLAFRDEEYLRKLGYDKTPDVKLDVPVAIDGFIINWIESKALFGGEEVHSEYIKKQYGSYWNRFGPGLVIYWFGFPKSIMEVEDKRFIIRDHLPTKNVVTLFPLPGKASQRQQKLS